MTVVTRFAPSPTGDLHLGHAYSAMFARERAQSRGGRFLVRIEDIDGERCRAGFESRNLADLEWLGLTSDEPPIRQSARTEVYRGALNRLERLGIVYPCLCTRKQIREEIARAGGAPQGAIGDGTGRYPGTCGRLDRTTGNARRAAGEPHALRLDGEAALALTGPLRWVDLRHGERAVDLCRLGDVVIARKEMPTSYHLAVVIDDAAQAVSEVTRGDDLLEVTHLHRLLQALLDLPVPVWHHHRLCRDRSGRRLAKRDGDTSIRALRQQGLTPAEVLERAAAAAETGSDRPGQCAVTMAAWAPVSAPPPDAPSRPAG
ncbi:MAG: tRNA glutamyl-Q(34) synthetase GluQRS [Rhodospirillales bacterium]|nr:MAG: tRNA glutamyl-Q(34) synthetase GluQRS [Rhodospirillales bacterium]